MLTMRKRRGLFPRAVRSWSCSTRLVGQWCVPVREVGAVLGGASAGVADTAVPRYYLPQHNNHSPLLASTTFYGRKRSSPTHLHYKHAYPSSPPRSRRAHTHNHTHTRARMTVDV